MIFIEHLVNGVTLGGLYALIALGYTLVYGVLQFINFAHGEVFMVGAYTGFLVFTALGSSNGPLWLILPMAFLGAMAVCAAFGILIERLAYRPLRHAPRLAPLITAIGVSLCLQNSVMLVLGKAPKTYPPVFSHQGYQWGEITVSPIKIFIILSAITLMTALHMFITRTRMGTAMRAVALDQRAATLMGISINRVIAWTFGIGSSLGAAAGVLVGLYYGQITFLMGYGAGLKAFTAAVLGGIGNVPGAMIGGFLLGIFEAIGGGINSQYQNAIAFVVLILVLTVRPGGIMSERVSDRV